MVAGLPNTRQGITVLILMVSEVHDLKPLSEMLLQESMLYFLVDKLIGRVSVNQYIKPRTARGLLTLS